MSEKSIYSIVEYDESTADEGLEELPALLRRLLLNRGITDPQEAAAFLDPEYETQTHDAAELKDVHAAVRRMLAAIEENEKAVIYSDYDTDGIPAAVILKDALERIGYENFRTYIPHRNTHGFGVHAEAIEEFAGDDVDLLITLDCGMGAADQVAQAKEAGIDTIIVDHHLPNGDVPSAEAIVNPKQDACEYPFDDLCAAAVTYKLAEVLLDRVREDDRFDFAAATPAGWEKWLLDMVGIATIADMVPLVGENRVLATYGLQVLQKSRRPGLRALFKNANIYQKRMNEEDIGFGIGPRINAASRMDAPEDAFNLLATRDPKEAKELASHLEKINNKRKGKVSAITKAVKKKLKKRDDIGPVVVSGDPEWMPSLLGLAANAIVDAYERPVFLWGRSGDGQLRGSARSDGSVNLVELMEAVSSNVFEVFGGHEHSGGFTLTEDGVHTLEEGLCSAHETIETSDIAAEHIVDAPLSLSDVSWETYDQIKQLAPFGKENSKPIFVFEGVKVDEVEHFGSNNNHLKIWCTKDGDDRTEAIEFFATKETYDGLAEGETIDLLANIEKSTFGGNTTLRLRIIDIIVES